MVPCHVIGRLEPGDGGAIEAEETSTLAVAVNGVIRAVTRSYRTEDGERFSAVVPEASFRTGANQIEVVRFEVDEVVGRKLVRIPTGRESEHRRRSFERSTATLLEAGPTASWEGVRAISHARLQEEDGGALRVHVTGPSPSLELPPVDAAGHRGLILELELESPGDALLWVFYATRDDPRYRPLRRVQHLVAEGANHLFVEIAEPGLTGRLRLDLGGEPGVYSLHSLAIRGLE